MTQSPYVVQVKYGSRKPKWFVLSYDSINLAGPFRTKMEAESALENL